jgi:hypothetical protein
VLWWLLLQAMSQDQKVKLTNQTLNMQGVFTISRAPCINAIKNSFIYYKTSYLSSNVNKAMMFASLKIIILKK